MMNENNFSGMLGGAPGLLKRQNAGGNVFCHRCKAYIENREERTFHIMVTKEYEYMIAEPTTPPKLKDSTLVFCQTCQQQFMNWFSENHKDQEIKRLREKIQMYELARSGWEEPQHNACKLQNTIPGHWGTDGNDDEE